MRPVLLVKRIGAGVLALVLLLALAVVWLVGPGNLARMAFGIGLVEDREPPALPALGKPAILIFSKTNGFRDSAQIAAANAALERIARERGWASFTTENAAIFNPRQLAGFAAVVWNSVSGDVLTVPQRAAFRQWLEQGHGFVGLHGAGGDPSYAWRWYVDDLIGAQFVGHTLSPHIQPGRLVVEDRSHPATRALPPVWLRADEWYSFDRSPRGRGYHVLVRIDEASYQPRERIPLLVDKDLAMGRDHPLVWTHCAGRGRTFYSALGHPARAYAEPLHLAMLAGALDWAIGLSGPDCAAPAAAIR